CSKCPAVKLDSMSAPDALQHMGAHILKDVHLKDANQPCGLYLNTGGLCQIYLHKHLKAPTVIDMKQSRCQNLKSFSVKTAAEFKLGSPCTNHPLTCPLCPSDAPAVWKYNLVQHLENSHHVPNIKVYHKLYDLDPAESTLMKKHLDAKPRAKRLKGSLSAMKISVAHGTRMVLR
ncbi:hypothetical protein BT96DRAFT_818334, partial [Gymnopus androsaceus JB14]